MKLVNVPHLLYQLGELIRPKTQEERRNRAFWSVVMLVIVSSIYYYLYLT